MDAQRYPKTDPVTTEIVRNGVLAVTEEMKTNLMRTAYNTIIYEALDFTTGLFTAKGETVSIGIGLPMFIRGMSEVVKAYETQSADIVKRWKALPQDKWDGQLAFFGSKRSASGMAWSFLFDIVHHRGQITTYLRPMGSTVPQIYGPSGDEP